MTLVHSQGVLWKSELPEWQEEPEKANLELQRKTVLQMKKKRDNGKIGKGKNNKEWPGSGEAANYERERQVYWKKADHERSC